MEAFTQFFGILLFLMLYTWRIVTPYLFYRDVVSGSLTCDSVGYIIIQGFISAGVAFMLIVQVGFRSLTDGLIIAAFLLMAVVSFYFGAKTWWWNKNKKNVEPGA